MSLVAFLKGINVGGYRTFRPSVLAKELQQFGVVNVGAAGTFVVRKRISRAKLRAEILRRLPFEAAVMICDDTEVLDLVSTDPFAGQPTGPRIIRFVSILAKRGRPLSSVPFTLPREGQWGLRVLTCNGRFVLGLHRREMKAISYLTRLERLLGVPVATRQWNTLLTIARILES